MASKKKKKKECIKVCTPYLVLKEKKKMIARIWIWYHLLQVLFLF